MSDVILPLVGPSALSTEWHAIRKFDASREIKCVFGATEAAACCGLSPYKTPFEVFVRKMTGTDIEENDAMRRGKRFEGPILDEYEDVRKVKMIRNLPMYLHGKHKWMGATPDAICVKWPCETDGPFDHWLSGVDAKSSTYRRLDKEGNDPMKFGEPGSDQMPIDYVFQGQVQCEVLNLPYVEFPVMFSRDYVPIYRVDRNEELIGFIIHAEKEMYERLLANDPPEPDWTHENTREMIALSFGHKQELVKELDADDVERWLEVQRKNEQMKSLKEEIDGEKNRLLFKMGAAAIGRFPSGTEQLKRIVVKDSLWTQKDADDARSNIGQVKRRGHERLTQTKVKE